MAQMRIFVSHSHEDDPFCRMLVQALRDAGADVWYDEHNLGSGRLSPTIERELRERPIFVVILSPAALRSQWVEDETRWAYSLVRKDAHRLILPVTATAFREDDLWLFLRDFKRIEAFGQRPYPMYEAVRRTLDALVLPQSTESPTDDLLSRSSYLRYAGNYKEALPLLKQATHNAPENSDAWYCLGEVYEGLEQWQEALTAYNHALVFNPGDSDTLVAKGYLLHRLNQYEEALDAYNQALVEDEHYGTWRAKGNTLFSLKRYEEALAAYDRALELDPYVTEAWYNKGLVLRYLKRYQEALDAYDRTLDCDSNYVLAWRGKSIILRAMGRMAEAEAAERRAKELGG